MKLSLDKATFLRALVPVALAFISAAIVVVAAGPTYVVTDDHVDISQNSMLLRFLWVLVFPFLMAPFIFWMRHKAVPVQKRIATIVGIISVLLASVLNYFLL